jgi:hypothetical protein
VCSRARAASLAGIRDLLAEGEAGLVALFDDNAAGPCTPPEEAVRTSSRARGAARRQRVAAFVGALGKKGGR